MLNRVGRERTGEVMATLADQITPTVEWLFDFDVVQRPDVEHRARLLVLDTLACMVAGLASPEPRTAMQRLSQLEPGLVRWPGMKAGLSASAASFVGAMAACWHEACEGLARAHGRPGLHAVPVALALGQQIGASFGEILNAIVAGFEIGGRAGEAMRIRAGLHVDGSWGVLGATATAARLQRFSPDQFMTAMAVAAGQMPVSQIAPIVDGKTARNTFAARACANGIMIAAAASAGVSGTSRSFDLAAETLATPGARPGPWAPPDEFLIREGYLKPYAAARHVHYGAACAIAHFTARGGDTASITSLELTVYPEAAIYCGNRTPSTPIQAQFSLSHGVAHALRVGTLGPEAYDPSVFADPEQRRLEALNTLISDPTIVDRGARLAIKTGHGDFKYTADSVAGDPDRPMSEVEVVAKARAYTVPHIGNSGADQLIHAVMATPLDVPIKI